MISLNQTSHLSWDLPHHLSLSSHLPSKVLIHIQEENMDIGSTANIIYPSIIIFFFFLSQLGNSDCIWQKPKLDWLSKNKEMDREINRKKKEKIKNRKRKKEGREIIKEIN